MQKPRKTGRATDAELARRVLSLYAEGWFPMGEERDGETRWVQPESRSVLPLGAGVFSVPGSLSQRVRSGRFEITADEAFERVIAACAGPRRIEGELETSTWITEEIEGVFGALHRAGSAHSVEAWCGAGPERRLVGGLYGAVLGGVFCGESMFSRPELGGTDASKVCLVHLVGHLRAQGFSLIDAQLANPHTARFGFVEKPRAWYLAEVERLAGSGAGWGVFDPARALTHAPEASAGGGRYSAGS